ncbi:MAG: hypothetical protein AB7V58_01320 [Solirubrobacterales bacterium]
MTATTLGIAIAVAIGFWLFGGIVLRVGGALIALAGLFGLAMNGDVNGLLVLVIGLLLWLAGHWHFALRHHEYKSPLAERVFQMLPERLDPTRHWGVRVAPVLPIDERRPGNDPSRSEEGDGV